MNHQFHIVALGARTAVGLNAESAAAAVRAGVSRIREHAFFVDASGEKLKSAQDARLDGELAGAERLTRMISASFAEVLRKLTLNSRQLPDVHVLIATPEARPGFSPQDARSVCDGLRRELEVNGVRGSASLCGEGHAGGLRGLELALHLLATGQSQLCVVGGVDGYLDADTLDWLEREHRLARSLARSGFPPGEAASVIAIAGPAARRALNLPSLARVRAVISGIEQRRADSREGLMGDALADVFERAAASLEQPGELFHDVYCDINGERARTDDYAFALLRTNQFFRDGSSYTTSVAECGDIGAASAIFNCVLATRARLRKYAHGPLALVWGASWGGLRAATLLETGAL